MRELSIRIKFTDASLGNEKDQKTGQLSEQMKSLQSFDVKNISEAEKKVIVLQKKIKSWESKIVSGFKTLQEHYEW